jgi:hypothetical protein
MKQFAILIAAVAIIGFFSSESFGQHYHGNRGYRGGSSFAISVGNGFGNGFTYAQGPRGNSFYGLNINSGYGYGRGFAPVYGRPVYRPVYPAYRPVYGGGFYGGGFYGGGGYGRRCGW